MGKRLDALLGRNFNTSKLKTLLKHAISRLPFLKNHHRARFSIAHSDLVQLLRLGCHNHALLRVDYMIKEQNMLDVFSIIEDYCLLLKQKLALLQNNRECPEELKEAISSLLFAEARCGEFPELHHIREIFTYKFGNEFIACAISFRSNSGVNPRIAEKLSTRQPSLESRLEALNEIASENGITLHLQTDTTKSIEENLVGKDTHDLPHENTWDRRFSKSSQAMDKYRDIATAGQEAIESESQDKGPPSNNSFIDGNETPEATSRSNLGLSFDNLYPIDNMSSESEDKKMAEINANYVESHSELDSGIDCSGGQKMPMNLGQNKQLSKDEDFNKNDDKVRRKGGSIPWSKHHDLDSELNLRSPTKEFFPKRNLDAIADENISEEDDSMHRFQYTKQAPQKFPPETITHTANSRLESPKATQFLPRHLNKERKPFSVRTRRTNRF